jgi:RimJ/RimL family protein N-acetyltransferase
VSSVLETVDAGEGRQVVIRPAEPGDAQGWIDLMIDVSREGPLTAVEDVQIKKGQLARFFRAGTWVGHQAYLAAAHDDALVGQLTLRRDFGAYKHTAELGMTVAKDYRRRGVGRALIRGAIKWAGDFGVEKITLMVFPHNQPALEIYRAMGFVEEGLRRKHAKLSYGYEDLIEMSYFLE